MLSTLKIIYYPGHFKSDEISNEVLNRPLKEVDSSDYRIEVVELDEGSVLNNITLPNLIFNISDITLAEKFYNRELDSFDVILDFISKIEKLFFANYSKNVTIRITFQYKINNSINVIINTFIPGKVFNKIGTTNYVFDNLINVIKEIYMFARFRNIYLVYSEEYPFWKFSSFDTVL